ncbi:MULTISPECIES: CocE/NonD family hydrolase [Mycobacteriaceae]|uniref:CocE/NonD family hydrolase n=1 Tax=Mycobacteriaceae TaxID=1762 RepID=UPI0007FDBA78|nr:MULTISPECIES: CocE/NonD family hydrolase [Mycobacteriaceae]MCK0177332.1 CocE/NonD family hydrolase [Mycolicibacterium sp. F2034L]OBB56298.1 hydrolase [Mycobacterium sp. 852013-51886_SCH5428379]
MTVLGKAVSRLLRLPPHTTDFTVDRGVRVPMRDGVDLLADHYIPTAAPSHRRPAGTLLVRCPYGRGFPFSTLFAVVYARRGYHVVVQSVRGTFGSGGDFEPMAHEREDGADTVVWLREQPWFTGTFATLGLSYLGFTQWALLTDPPPELRAAVIAVGPHDFHTSSWGTGSFSLNDFLGWSDMMAHQEDPGRLNALVRQVRAGRTVARAAAGVPLGEAGRRLLGAGAPWYESWLQDPDDTAFWDRLRAADALDRVQVPVLLFSGWQDLFLDQTLAQYAQLRDRGVPVALTVGSWTHSQVMTKGAPTVLRETLDWLGTHLDGAPGARTRRVRFEINGGGWCELDDWPPQVGERELFLTPGGGLTADPPAATAAPSSFVYDPADPTPTVGGRLLSAKGGYRRDDRLAARSDVLTFTGAPLSADLYVIGTPVVELSCASDNPHRDLFVRLSAVDAKGRSRNVSEGFRRLTGPDGTVRLELDAVAHRFRAGSRLRVLVAGGSHPRFARNLGTGEPPITGRRMTKAVHTVRHGQGGISRIVLPAADRPPSAH